jgi:hypothetical protein
MATITIDSFMFFLLLLGVFMLGWALGIMDGLNSKKPKKRHQVTPIPDETDTTGGYS